jgi:proton glutamate symport protein
LKASPIRILIGLILGAALGYLCVRSRSPLLMHVPGILAPLGSLFINAIRICVIPLVTSSLIVGCAVSRDTGQVGRLAGRSLALMLLYLSIAAMFAGVTAIPVFAHLRAAKNAGTTHTLQKTRSAAASNHRAESGEWVSDLMPSNLFKAASDGALLPLIIFSVAFGVTLSRMTEAHRDPLLQWFRAVSEAFTRLIDIVLQVAHIGVFCLAVNLATATELGRVSELAWYVLVLSLVSGAFVVVVLYPSVAVFARISLLTFVRAATPAQALAFTSRSSLAALPATYQAAHEGLGIPDEVSSFFFPFAASIFRVGGCIAQVVGISFLASFYGIPLSWSKLASIAVNAIAVSLTIPGIPGGAIIVMSPILSAMGIPLEGMAMLLAVDTIPDMFRTMANVTGWLSAGAILSRRTTPLLGGLPRVSQADLESIS